MRIKILMSAACVLGAVACSNSSSPPANDPSNTSTTGAAVTAPIVTAGSTTNQESAAVNPDPSTQNGSVPTTAGSTKNFSGSTIAPVATGDTSAQLGATPVSTTPMTQGTAKSDVQITASIRKHVAAKHVTVITNGSKVTLTGTVKSDSEKSTIESAARSTAGVSGVDDQITVKP